jgi:hypothetical protein
MARNSIVVWGYHRQLWKWTFMSSGLSCWVVGQAVPHIAKDHTAFIFRIKQFFGTAWPWRWRQYSLYPTTQYNNLKDCSLQQHGCKNVRSWTGDHMLMTTGTNLEILANEVIVSFNWYVLLSPGSVLWMSLVLNAGAQKTVILYRVWGCHRSICEY